VFHTSTLAKNQMLKDKMPLNMTRYDLGKGNNFKDIYTKDLKLSRMTHDNFLAIHNTKDNIARESVSVQSVEYFQEPFGMT